MLGVRPRCSCCVGEARESPLEVMLDAEAASTTCGFGAAGGGVSSTGESGGGGMFVPSVRE